MYVNVMLPQLKIFSLGSDPKVLPLAWWMMFSTVRPNCNFLLVQIQCQADDSRISLAWKCSLNSIRPSLFVTCWTTEKSPGPLETGRRSMSGELSSDRTVEKSY